MLHMKKIREQQGVSLTKLCVLTGIHPANLSRIEKGYIYPFPGWRKRIAKALNVREEEIFGDFTGRDFQVSQEAKE